VGRLELKEELDMKNAFSIIIPTLNAEKFIDKCLTSIDNLDYPKDAVEVIIVDNGSTDKTLAIAKEHNAKIFIKEKCNVSELRNFGAQQAVNNLLAFVDSDCALPAHWLREAKEFLRLNGVAAIGCWYKLSDSPSWIEKVWDIHMRDRRSVIGEINWVPSGNFIIYREIFEKIHGFDESLITSEDVDICERIRHLGLVIYSHPSLAIEHLGDSNTIKKYFKKESWRGEGVYQNFLRHLPQLRLNKALILAFFTTLLCVGAVLGICEDFIVGDIHLFAYSVSGLILVPLLLSVKTLAVHKQWQYLFPLAFLFLLYSIARATSPFKIRVWRHN
jgi:glycosyltransferase involved in cell wall biosynthesis